MQSTQFMPFERTLVLFVYMLFFAFEFDVFVRWELFCFILINMSHSNVVITLCPPTYPHKVTKGYR